MPEPPKETAAQKFGRELRRTRRHKELTQLNLAHLAGCTVAAISNYENGHTLPTVATLLDLAYVLDVDPGTLIAGLKPDVPPTDLLG